MYKSITPNILVDDVSETIDYYQHILGFSLVHAVPEKGPLHWAMLSADHLSLMFQDKDSIEKELPYMQHVEHGHSFTLFIEVDDIDEVYNRIKSQVDVVKDLHRTFYDMKEFSFADLNGYVVTIAQEIKAE